MFDAIYRYRKVCRMMGKLKGLKWPEWDTVKSTLSKVAVVAGLTVASMDAWEEFSNQGKFTSKGKPKMPKKGKKNKG
jgi:hypothetical protein